MRSLTICRIWLTMFTMKYTRHHPGFAFRPILIGSLATLILFVACANKQVRVPSQPAPQDEPKTIEGLAKQAADQSTLTLPGSAPFHLKARIKEKDSPDSDYQAQIEEYWAAPDKWRRTIESAEFSQVRIVNGGKVHEENSGDYFPHWLRNFVTALETPLPMGEMILSPGATELIGSAKCVRFYRTVGIPPATNSIFDVICIDKNGRLDSVVTPAYSAEFRDYEPFGEKYVARLISDDPEPGTHIEAHVTGLSNLTSPDQAMFAVDKPTPLDQQIGTITIAENTARNLLVSSPEIHWPTVRDGKTSGVLSVLVSADRNGHVREAWGLNSDNPWMTDAARKQLLEWKLKPAKSNGLPTQIESILTFAFDTTIENPFPLLSNEEGRKRAIRITEPTFQPEVASSGTVFVLRISVDESGDVMGIGNTENVATPLVLAVSAAARGWKFKPLVQDGKPTPFHTDMKFRVP